MKWLSVLIIAVAIAVTSVISAWAGVVNVTVTGTSTAIFAANDVGTKRNYLFLTNLGPNPVWCAQNTGNTASTTNGFYLGQYGNYEGGGNGPPPTGSSPGALLPAYDVACVSINSGATVIGIDY